MVLELKPIERENILSKASLLMLLISRITEITNLSLILIGGVVGLLQISPRVNPRKLNWHSLHSLLTSPNACSSFTTYRVVLTVCSLQRFSFMYLLAKHSYPQPHRLPPTSTQRPQSTPHHHPPGDNSPSCIPRDWMGWGGRPASLFELAQGEDKALYSKLGSSLCTAEGGSQGSVTVRFGKALEQDHS